MTARDLRLVPVALCVWGSALLCTAMPVMAGACGLVCGAAAVAVVLGSAGVRRRRRAGTVGLVVVMLASAAAVAVAVGFALPARDRVAAHGGRVVEVIGDVSSSASLGQDGRLWVEAITVDIGSPGRREPLSAPIRIGVTPADGFDLGARIRVVGETSVTSPGERAALVVYASEAEVRTPAEGVFAIAAEARKTFVARSVRLPEPGAGLLPGLAVGDTRAVGVELNDDMKASGLSHLTAVSGANCAIVVGAVFWFTALCGGGRRLRVLLSLAALGGFVVLVTPEASVIRAAVMATAGMLTILLGRPRAGAGILALCTVAILVADPWLAWSAGFALSVAASGALVLLAPGLGAGLGRWMPQPLAVAIAVPLAAQLACGPIIALFADQQSLVGVAANLIAAPAAPIATVAGLLACLAAPLPAVADILTASAWLPASWIATTAEVSADMPGALLLLPAGIGSAVLVAVVSASVALLLIRIRGDDLRTRWRLSLARRAAAVVLIVMLALAGARLLLDGPLATATAPDGWEIAACDVGQGDALLVRSADAVALIDTGPEPSRLEHCLTSLGIDRIDLLVLTHFDLDHVGGVDAVRGKVASVLHGPVAGRGDQRVLDALSAGGASLQQAAAGGHGLLGASTWRILWPQRDSAAFPAGNDASVVLEFDGGGVPRSLFLGDLSAAPQRMLLRTARLPAYDVVKVAHHGSADQDAELYDAIRARVALISVGVDNDYGHPRSETLDLLDAAGSKVFRTDRQGRILLGLRDGALTVWTETVPP